MLKLNKLFIYEDQPEAFNLTIQPTEQQRLFLTGCKNAIRDHLRDGIRSASKTVLGMDKVIEPRFRTQGSWSYRTCVQGAYQPPQQMDWDFGVYLPATTWENHRPRVAAKVYFALVEQLLESLCQRKGWQLLKGQACKDTCIRVQVAAWAHIDIPLYAAPEAKFLQILERAINMDAASTHDAVYLAESAVYGEPPDWSWVDLDEIVLATRSGEWKPSDPAAVSNWFNDRIAEHGEQLRRVWRYIKAWRDYVWPDGGGPSSVMLMIAVAQGFQPSPKRDDLALEHVAAHLITALGLDIREVAIDDGSEDFNRLDARERRDACMKAADLRNSIRDARTCTVNEKGQSIEGLRGQFGDRIPYRLDWLDIDGQAEIVRSTEATVVPLPRVTTTKAG